MKEEVSYIFVKSTNEYTPLALMSTWFSFVSLKKTWSLSFSIISSEPTSDWRKPNKGWGWIEKAAETKFSIQYIKKKPSTIKENWGAYNLNHSCTCKLQ